MKKNILVGALFLLCAQAFASVAELGWADGYEQSGENVGAAMCLAVGFFGAITCRQHDALVASQTPGIAKALRWLLTVSIVLAALPILGNHLGFYFDRDAWKTAISIWGVCKAAHGLFISGFAAGQKAN